MPNVPLAYYHMLRELRLRVPALWRAEKVLYIGANRCANPGLVDELKAAGAAVHLLEAWDQNVAYYREKDPDKFASITQGDARDLPGDLGMFDAVVWWHGPEHLPADEWPTVVRALESMAPLVILGCPWGVWEQGEADGNPFEPHLSSIYPADLDAMGYEVRAVGTGADQASYLVAWGGETGASADEWYYAKLSTSPTFWLVRDGRREALGSAAEMYAVGLLPVRVVKEEELEAIPVRQGDAAFS